ncbi:hypothetical protein ACWD7C_08800 [Streptomyces sp. NPDC005134]|uniref:hypothetical protein n=1 Tax=unclassified Streptomyces TaxID=2593676 RepID=UPI0033BE6728
MGDAKGDTLASGHRVVDVGFLDKFTSTMLTEIGSVNLFLDVFASPVMVISN